MLFQFPVLFWPNEPWRGKALFDLYFQVVEHLLGKSEPELEHQLEAENMD